MSISIRASSWERRRPLILTILCVVFAAWFAYDGWLNYPGEDDGIVAQMMNSDTVTPADKATLKEWPGWYNSTPQQREDYTTLIRDKNNESDWHSATDILVQRWIVVFLAAAALCAFVWYLRVAKRTMTADEKGLTLVDGRIIGWESITRIDNRRWTSDELVILEYEDHAGAKQNLVLDAALFESMPVFLTEVANRAVKAQIIHPEQPSGTS